MLQATPTANLGSCFRVFCVSRYVDSWKRHQALWKTEKASVMDKFKIKHPSNADFEEKLAKYAKLADDVWRQASTTMLLTACKQLQLSLAKPYAC